MNILVTGVGAIIGYGIINSLKLINDREIFIVGMDIYDDAYGQCLCDKFYVAERADSEKYLQFIQNIIVEEKIDLIIPGIEQDMYKLHTIKDSLPTKIVLNNDLLIRLSKDKWETFRHFSDFTQIELIPTLCESSYTDCVKNLGSPFLLKPRSSYASKGIHKIYSEEEFIFYNKQQSSNIFQRIVGTDNDEFTISVFGDGLGAYSDYIILKRKLAQTGATDKAEVVGYDKDIMDYVSSICQLTKPIGPTNIQLRKEGEKVFLLEINPRISSACSIRTAAGYNEPEMCLKVYLFEEKIQVKEKREIKAIRYVKDYIYECLKVYLFEEKIQVKEKREIKAIRYVKDYIYE